MTERRRHPAARTRIATAGIGLAAMVALVSRMEVTSGRAQAASLAPSSAWSGGTVATADREVVQRARLAAVAAAKPSRPIVLTPHAVVHTVTVRSSGGSGGYSGSTYAAAPAPAAAPVASTGGSHP